MAIDVDLKGKSMVSVTPFIRSIDAHANGEVGVIDTLDVFGGGRVRCIIITSIWGGVLGDICAVDLNRDIDAGNVFVDRHLHDVWPQGASTRGHEECLQSNSLGWVDAR